MVYHFVVIGLIKEVISSCVAMRYYAVKDGNAVPRVGVWRYIPIFMGLWCNASCSSGTH